MSSSSSTITTNKKSSNAHNPPHGLEWFRAGSGFQMLVKLIGIGVLALWGNTSLVKTYNDHGEEYQHQHLAVEGNDTTNAQKSSDTIQQQPQNALSPSSSNSSSSFLTVEHQERDLWLKNTIQDKNITGTSRPPTPRTNTTIKMSSIQQQQTSPIESKLRQEKEQEHQHHVVEDNYTNTNTTVHKISNSNSSIDTTLVDLFSITSYFEYSLQIETFCNDKFNDWLERDIPILLNSFQLPNGKKDDNKNNHYYDHHIQFYLRQLDENDFVKWQYANWTCHYHDNDNNSMNLLPQDSMYTMSLPMMESDNNNDNNNNNNMDHKWQVLPARLERFKKRASEMMVICPNQTYQEKILTHTSVIPLNSTTSSYPISYDVRPYLRWDELARNEPPPQAQQVQHQQQHHVQDKGKNSNTKTATTTKPLFIAACTEITGEESYHLTAQWIEYHRLLGVDHFWIYINEPFNETLPYYNNSNSYVTYVPYNYRLEERWDYVHRKVVGYCFIQKAQNTECMYRGRQYGVDWMVMTDVDEYIHINTPELANKTGPILREYLELEPSNTADIRLEPIFYGRNTILNHPSTKTIAEFKDTMILDYIWRSNAPLDEHKKKRMGHRRFKHITRPDKTGWLNIHWSGQFKKGYKPKFREVSEIRIDHYKQPMKFVFDANQNDLGADPELRNLFGPMLRDALQQNWNRTFHPIQAIPQK